MQLTSDGYQVPPTRAELRAARPDLEEARVLWGVFGTLSSSCPDARYAVWWRVPGRKQGRALLSGRPDRPHTDQERDMVRCSGPAAGWTPEAQATFDVHVRPHLTPEQAERALKVTRGWETTSHTCGVGEHPYQPGVLQAFELRTEYCAETTPPRKTPGQWMHGGVDSAARVCRFRCRQTRRLAQLRGTRLLLIGAGVRNVAYGRGDFSGFSPDGLAQLSVLADVLASRTCNPGELAQYHRTFPESAQTPEAIADRLLCASRPTLLGHPGLREYLRHLPQPAWRAYLRRRESAAQTLTRVCGAVPRPVRAALSTHAGLALAAALQTAGVTSPDLKAQVLGALLAQDAARRALNARAAETHADDPFGPPYSQPLSPRETDLDLAWYAAHVGPDRAAREVVRSLQVRPGTVRLGAPRLDLFWLSASLTDGGRMLREIQTLLPGFTLSARDRGVGRLHDQLAAAHSKLNIEDLPIPSAQLARFGRLDVTLQNAQGRTVTFTRAGQVRELVQASATLHNCVSSYHRAAVDGHTVIVLGREAGRLTICLEVVSGHVRQYVHDHDQRPSTPDDLALAGAYQAAAGVRGHYPDVGGWWPSEGQGQEAAD